MGYIVQHIENEQDVAGWGLTLKHTCGESDARGCIGCQTAEDAVALFLAESSDFSEDDITEVTPIFDYRLSPESKEILAITSGDYSDYTVWAVFTTEDAAARYRDQLGLVEYNVCIKKLPVNPEIPIIVEGVGILMGRDGEVLIAPRPKHYRSHKIGFRSYGFKRDGTRTLFWTVQTGDVKKAIKVVNEKRLMLIASEVWASGPRTREVLGLA